MTKSAATGTVELDSSLLDATADTALVAINRVAGDPDQLIREWIKRANAPAISEVAERGTGPARKAARRALNVLRARGVRAPERNRVANLAARPELVHEAWLLAPDSAGNFMFVFTAHSPASRYQAAFVILHEAVGVQRVELAELSQSQLRDAMAKAAPGGDYRPVRVPLEWARARVANVRKRHTELGHPEPLGLTTASSLLEPVPSEIPAHPFDDEGLELSDDDARELAKQSARLHALPEFRNWLPARPAVDELLEQVGNELTPGQEPDPEAFRACIDRQIIAATDRYFSPERRQALLGSLKDCALSVLQREGEVTALDVVAVMKLVERAGLITDPPHEIPFLRAFFEKAVSVLAAQGQGRLRIPMRRAADGSEAQPVQGEAPPAPSDEPAQAPQASSEG